MTPPRKLLFIGDVGGESVRHVGDEAMLEANIAGCRALFPGVEATVVSREPAWITSRYGVDSVPLFGFSGGRDAGAGRGELLERLRAEAVASGSTNATIDALRGADALVISGGGNLSSSWPDLLFERIALLTLAAVLGKPSIVVGQTIGPRLEPDEARLLGEALRQARLVGVREIPSFAFAVALGVPQVRLWYQSDDALFLGEGTGDRAAHGVSSGTIAITIDPQVRAWGQGLFAAIAEQLRELAEVTGATPVLVPHMYGGEAAGLPSDLTEARLLADAIGLERTKIVEGGDAETAARLAHDAELVVSSRYHPLVFAMSAGTPSIGIYPDEYCRIKLQGALAHAGVENWAIPFDAASGGRLLELARGLWDDRVKLRQRLASFQPEWREESRSRWSAIGRILEGTDDAERGQAPARHAGYDTTLLRNLLGAMESQRREQQLRAEAVARLSALCHAQGLELQQLSGLRDRQSHELRELSALRAEQGEELQRLVALHEAQKRALEVLEDRFETLHRHAISIDTMARPYLAMRELASRVVRRVLRRRRDG